jgi:hypothetical protein
MTTMTTGRDAFGSTYMAPDYCVACDEPGACISWEDITLPDYQGKGPLLPERTILRRKDGALGIQCGCYAKFHRQIARITTEAKFRDKGVK